MLTGIGDLLPVVRLCLDKGVTFAACALPGSDGFRLFIPSVGLEPVSADVFEIGRWLDPYSRRIVVDGEVSADEALRSLSELPDVMPVEAPSYWRSTSRKDYLAHVAAVRDACRRRDGKTVFSRVVCGRMDEAFSPVDLFGGMCKSFPCTFRHIFHTPDTGSWMGATPELLLHADVTAGTFRTVALAGTRRRSAGTWDAKNIRENLFVSRFIVDTARHLGLDVTLSEIGTISYGSEIEHICRDITGKLPAEGFIPLLDRLNPTPALCGTPKGKAVADIARYEGHARECYGGFVALRSPGEINAFVNLRCCRFQGGALRAFAGGGITPESVPEREWDESQAKSAFFRRYVKEFL